MEDAIVDVFSCPHCDLSSDHFPLIAKIQLKFAAGETKALVKRSFVDTQDEALNKVFNAEVRKVVGSGSEPRLDNWLSAFAVATPTLPVIVTTRKGRVVSEESMKLLEARAALRKLGKVEEAGKLTKTIQKALRKDRKAEVIRATGKDLTLVLRPSSSSSQAPPLFQVPPHGLVVVLLCRL